MREIKNYHIYIIGIIVTIYNLVILKCYYIFVYLFLKLFLLYIFVNVRVFCEIRDIIVLYYNFSRLKIVILIMSGIFILLYPTLMF